MAHGDARKGKWRGNLRMEWVASTLHTTSDHGVSSITTADVHTSAASSRLNWRPCWFKWTRPFRRMTKSGFCACVITFQSPNDEIWFLRVCHHIANAVYSIQSSTNQYGWLWCVSFIQDTQCTHTVTLRCVRVTIVAVGSATANSLLIAVDLLASVNNIKGYSVIMDIQQCIRSALLMGYEVFRTACQSI